MRLRFTKMHGLGNDFVMLDGVSQQINLSTAKLKKLADRNFGVGCDQILLVEPPKKLTADFRYRIFNANGGEVENCGNGARCFAVFVQQRGLIAKNQIVVETKCGEMILKVLPDKQVTVDMGAPELSPEKIPFKADTQAITYPLNVDGKDYDIAAVSMGNPHAVTLVDDVESFPVAKIGRRIEAHKRFPQRVNAGFMQVVSRAEANLRVFERGVGETLACGTGACAAMVAGRLREMLDSEVIFHLRGGDLKMEWAGPGEHVKMTGPATTVFHGQIKI